MVATRASELFLQLSCDYLLSRVSWVVGVKPQKTYSKVTTGLLVEKGLLAKTLATLCFYWWAL